MDGVPSRRVSGRLAAVIVAIAGAALLLTAGSAVAGVKPRSVGALDCNGYSPIQRTLHAGMACTDPRAISNGASARFEDNEHYIGHDEPIVRFLSNRPGSGGDVTWTETLPRDPAALPTTTSPGSDVTHTFELTIAPWFSMALCNSKSFPLRRCIPNSDSNAPNPADPTSGGGSSFLETQFYPPGFAPFVDSISCDNAHWCASLHINDLECTRAGGCNNNCTEPTNFAFIQTNGVPTGPPSPQLANLATQTPNSHTLLMNPGDRIRMHIFDAPVPGGHGKALKEVITDLTTGRTGFMQASAKNGYMATSVKNCSGTPFNYQPEYSTARPANSVPWAALETNIATDFEIGHFEPCTRVTNPVPFPGLNDTMWQDCKGPYEANNADEQGVEGTDAPCYRKGDTHGGVAPPNEVTGCALLFSGDFDFDGTPYWPDWPSSLTPNRHPSPFLQEQPTTNGHLFGRIQFQTEAPASMTSCMPSGQGCRVPAPGSPGGFYPYFTLAKVHGSCVWEFGQMPNGNDFGKDHQYGKPSERFFADLESRFMPAPSRTSC
jgi:hypothetical protein